MTNKELLQLKHLNKEIELLQKQIQDVETRVAVDSVTGSFPEFPYTQHTIRIEGIDEKYMEHRRNKLNRRLKKLLDKRDELENYISSVSDSEMRMILTLRYADGLLWQQVALKIGEYDESYPGRKHNNFLELAENAEK